MELYIRTAVSNGVMRIQRAVSKLEWSWKVRMLPQIGMKESNLQPDGPEPSALPIELIPNTLVPISSNLFKVFFKERTECSVIPF